MRLYSISDEYINYLRRKFPRVYSNKENEMELKATLQIGTMIPVPDGVIELCK